MTNNSIDEAAGITGSILIAGVGSSNGLGAAIARRFGAEGYPVVIAGRSADKLEATSAELEESGISVQAVAGDVASQEDVRGFVAAAPGPGAPGDRCAQCRQQPSRTLPGAGAGRI